MLNELPSTVDDELLDINEQYTNHDDVTESPDDRFSDFQQKGLHFLHINIRSLRNKVTELKIIAERTSAGIIAVSETWLDTSVTEAEVASHGGGVCVYIRSDLSYNPRTDLNDDNVESLWLDLFMKKTKPLLIGCIYRPPDQQNFIELFQETLDNITGRETIILGDINIDVQKNCSFVKRYVSLLNMNGLKQIVTKPTRVTKYTSTILDHIIVSDCSKITKCDVLPVGISDHYLTYCTRKVMRSAVGTHNFINVRSMKHYSKEALVQKLQETDWHCVLSCANVNLAWKKFETTVCSVINSIAPRKQCRAKVRSEPWLTSEILECINRRDNLLRKFRVTKDVLCHRQFYAERNHVQQLVKQAKKDFILNEIQENRKNSKNLWDSLKMLG